MTKRYTTTDTSFGRLQTREATRQEAARQIVNENKAKAARARLEAFRAEFSALRTDALELGARADMAPGYCPPRWRAVLTSEDFDAACAAYALRALADADPNGYEMQRDRKRSPLQYITAARAILAIAREDAESDSRTQSREGGE